MPPLLYSISIAAHNLWPTTEQCLRSVHATTDQRSEVILVDNGSMDGTSEKAQELWKYLAAISKYKGRSSADLKVLRSEQNGGYIAAHTKALEEARGVYLVVLNNDMTLEGDWLGALREAFRDPALAVAGATGGCSGLDEETGRGKNSPTTEYVEGSLLMVPTWLAKRHGLFDPSFRFIYAEDADLALRMRKRGHHIMRLPIKASHRNGSTTVALAKNEGVDMDGYHALNHLVLRRKWGKYLKTRNFRERISLRRKGAFGDVLLATPVIRQLKADNCEAEISVKTECPDVLCGNPDVSAAGPYLDGEYDRTFNLEYELTPKVHIIDAYAEICGVKLEERLLKVYPSPEDRKFASEVMAGGKWDYAVVHLSLTDWTGRNVPVETFAAVMERLEDLGIVSVVVGESSHTPAPAGSFMDLRGRTTFHQLAAVIERAKVFIGIDSLPMHLAQAAMIPTVGMFGAIDPTLRLLDFPFIRSVQVRGLGCLGCHHEMPVPSYHSNCIRERPYCMERIDSEAVVAEAIIAMQHRKMYLETSKIRERVLHLGSESIAEVTWPGLRGNGIDIGCGRDPITSDCVAFDDDPWPEVTHVGDARKLPFPDGHFDFAFSSHALEDFADTELVLQEWLRVIRVGGTIGLYVPHPDLYKGYNQDHKVTGFTPEGLGWFLRKLGCKILVSEIDDRPPECYSTLMVARKAT